MGGYPVLAVLLAALALAGIAALFFARGWVRAGERALARIAARPALAILLAGGLSLVLQTAIGLTVRMPLPSVHDEFSYLLAADTFAHGRLSNPTHPLWRHFESMHIFHQPTYGSKYPPGAGLVLAAGQVVTGYPIAGVWLCSALACAALCWMLQGWLPSRWAFFGGLLAVLHPLLLGWGQIYWGGALGTLGGALVLGAIPRLTRKLCPGVALTMAVGVAILANSRPYEGMILTLLAGVVLIAFRLRAVQRAWGRFVLSVAMPGAAVLLLTAGAMAYYNFRVTGSPLRMPYSVHSQQYTAGPTFLFQTPRPFPTYAHKELHDFHLGWELSFFTDQQTLGGFVSEASRRIAMLGWSLFPNMAYWLPLVAVPFLWRRGLWTRIALGGLAVYVLALFPVTWFQPHYAAPIIGLVFVILVQALRVIGAWRWQGLPLGRVLVRATLPLALLGVAGLCVDLSRQKEGELGLHRARLIAALEATGDKHLVIVRYGSGHSLHHEWVYNGADIDAGTVVWAREMDDAANRQLLDYYRDRHAWLLQVNDGPLPLVPYSEAPPRR